MKLENSIGRYELIRALCSRKPPAQTDYVPHPPWYHDHISSVLICGVAACSVHTKGVDIIYIRCSYQQPYLSSRPLYS
jgi:hypothetical protein